MTQTVITAGDATSAASVVQGGNDGTLKVVVGPAGGKVDAMSIDAAGNVTFLGKGGLQIGTLQATTSGTSKLFSIPSWVKRITVNFNGVSFATTGLPLIQIGPAAGLETTLYKSECHYIGGTHQAATDGFICGVNGGGAGNTYHGSYVLATLGSNIWVGSSNLAVLDGNTGVVAAGGSKTLADTITQLAIKAHDGGAFDAGSVNILLEG